MGAGTLHPGTGPLSQVRAGPLGGYGHRVSPSPWLEYPVWGDVALHPVPGVQVRADIRGVGGSHEYGLLGTFQGRGTGTRGGEDMKREVLVDENGEPWGIAFTLDDPDNDGSELFNELTRILGDD